MAFGGLAPSLPFPRPWVFAVHVHLKYITCFYFFLKIMLMRVVCLQLVVINCVTQYQVASFLHKTTVSVTSEIQTQRNDCRCSFSIQTDTTMLKIGNNHNNSSLSLNEHSMGSHISTVH